MGFRVLKKTEGKGVGGKGTSREVSKLVMALQPPVSTKALAEGGKVNMRARRRERADSVAGRRVEASRVKSDTKIGMRRGKRLEGNVSHRPRALCRARAAERAVDGARRRRRRPAQQPAAARRLEDRN